MTNNNSDFKLRYVIFALVGITIFLSVTQSSFAAVCPADLSGGGTFQNPCNVTNCVQLQNMSLNSTAHYALQNNVDCSDTINWNSGSGFLPIASFSRTLNGYGYNISNLYINRTSTSNVGLFGSITGANISNIGLVNCNISGAASTGGFVGYLSTGKVNNSFVIGNISGTTQVGGIAGSFWTSSVNNSYVIGNVWGTSSSVAGIVGRDQTGTSSLAFYENLYFIGNVSSGSDSNYVGGIEGYKDEGSIKNSYVIANISGGSRVGGIAGYFWRGTLLNCYSLGNLTASSDGGGVIGYANSVGTLNDSFSRMEIACSSSTCGGLVGENGGWTISNSYSTGNNSVSAGGGLIGTNIGTVTNCFWDNQTSRTTSSGGTGKTTSQMKSIATFTSTSTAGMTAPVWDFANNPNDDVRNNNYWHINPNMNNGYPFLIGIGMGIGFDVVNPFVTFENPTPVNNVNTTNRSVIINATVTNADTISNITYNWNGTNYNMYNNSMVLMYNFDNVSALGENNTYVVDSSLSGNNGTVNGSTWNATGKYGGAYQFDGVDDWVQLPNSQSLNITTPITIALWEKTSSSIDVTASWGMMLLGRGEYGDPMNSINIRIRATGDTALFNYEYDVGNDSDSAIGTTDIADGNWHFVVGMWNGSNCLVFVDGVLEGNASCPNTPGPFDEQFIIGKSLFSTQDYFNGNIDEVRIWNVSLSASEVYQQYISNLNKYDTDKYLFYINQSKNTTAGLIDGVYTYNFSSYDNSSNLGSSQRTITIDTTPPYFTNITNQTKELGSSLGYDINASDALSFSCFSVNDTTNFAINCSGYLRNNTNLSVNTYWLNISINDSTGNNNSTFMWVNVTDTAAPRLTITTPSNRTNSSNTGLNVNYTVSDLSPISYCWYSNDTMNVNATLNGCANITTMVWSEGQHNVTVWANDTYGNTNKSSVNFTIDTIPPTVNNITYPVNGTNYSTNVNALNYTVSDSGTLSKCWYGNGTSNSTTYTAGTNFTSVTSVEGWNNWTVYCNDTANNVGSRLAQFYKDSRGPTYSENSTSSTSAGFPIEHNLMWSDDTGLSGYVFSFCNGTYSYTYSVSQTPIQRSCGNVYCVEQGSGLSCSCNSLNTLNDLNNITISAKSNSLSFLNTSYTLPAISTDAVSINVCMNLSSMTTTDTSVANGLRIFWWNGTTWNLMMTRTSYSATNTWTNDSFCNNTFVTTPTGTNALNISVVFTGDSTSTNDTWRVDLLQTNISYSLMVNSSSLCSDSYANMTNDTWIAFSSTWSSVTKIVTDTLSSTIKWCVYANDTFNNWNSTSCTNPFSYITNVSGNTAPTWSLNSTLLSSPQTYSPNTSYGFQVKWDDDTDTNGYNFSYIEHNFTGTLTNYTTIRSENVTYYNFTGMGGGNWQYRFYANDTSNAWNRTDISIYIISQNQTNPIDIYLINSSGTYHNQNITTTDITSITANSTLAYSSSGTASLYEDSSSVSNPRTTILLVGLHSYKGNTTGNANYTSNATGLTFYINVSDTTAPNVTLNLPVENYYNDTSNPFNTTFNCSSMDNYNLTNISLYITNRYNTTLSFNQTRDITSTTNSTTWSLNLSSGNYTWNCLAYDSYGNYNWSTNRTIKINFTDTDNDNVRNDLDTLEGDESNTNTAGISNLNISVGGNSTSGSFSDAHNVVFNESSNIIMNFTHNFTASQLNLNRITIIKSTNYIIVNLSNQLQSDYNKTIYIDDSNFISLCVKDAEVSSVNDISSGCNGANETDFTACLGGSASINGINCTDEGTRIKIDNLRFSAIRGTPQTTESVVGSTSSSASSSGCTSDNQCESKKACIDKKCTKVDCKKDVDCGEREYCSNYKCYDYECVSDSDCKTDQGEECLNYRCVKLFDIIIENFQPSAKAGEFFNFTYFLKSMGNISDDVEITFWIEKDGAVLTSGKDTIYVGPSGDQRNTAKIFLPSTINPDVYMFFVQVSYKDYSASSYRTIEITLDKEGNVVITDVSDRERTLTYVVIGLASFSVLLTIIIILLRRTHISLFFTRIFFSVSKTERRTSSSLKDVLFIVERIIYKLMRLRRKIFMFFRFEFPSYISLFILKLGRLKRKIISFFRRDKKEAEEFS